MFKAFSPPRFLVTLALSSAFAAVSQGALAQPVGPGTGPGYGGPDSPVYEATEATIGSEFSQYRDAIAARRLSLGRPLATQDSNSVTGGNAPGWNGVYSAWAAVDAKFLNGTYSGSSTSLIFGADTLAGSATLIGLIGGYNYSSVTLPSNERVKARGITVGPYFSTQLSDSLSLDGFIAYGEPSYNVDGGKFNGKKVFGNLTLTGYVPLSNAELFPFISIASARERLPGFFAPITTVTYAPTKIKSLVGTIGTSVSYNPIEKGNLLYLPSAGIEVDFVRNDDGFGNKDTFQTLRLKGGVSIIGDNGGWNLGADVARTSEGTTSYGANATYVWQF